MVCPSCTGPAGTKSPITPQITPQTPPNASPGPPSRCWGAHGDSSVSQLCPSIEIQQPVDAADLAAHQPLALGQRRPLRPVQVIDGGDRRQPWTSGTPHQPWDPPSPWRGSPGIGEPRVVRMAVKVWWIQSFAGPQGLVALKVLGGPQRVWGFLGVWWHPKIPRG